MKETWDRIEAWLRANASAALGSLRPGASDLEIADTERFLGVTFPNDLRASYRIHDGTEEGHRLIDGWDLLSLGGMRAIWKIWNEARATMRSLSGLQGELGNARRGSRSDTRKAR